MTLDTAFERRSLPLNEPFAIARGTQAIAENVFVSVTDGAGRTGIGGAAPSGHYGETGETVTALLPELLAVVEESGDPHALARIERNVRGVVRGNPAARCAVSIALHDLLGKRLDLPLYRYWGLDPAATVETSYSVGLGSTEEMAETAAAAVADGFSILKVKLGTDRDREIVAAIRGAAPEATVRVDANEAWTPREAIRKIDALETHGVEFVEQPVSAEDPRGLRFVHERAALPIAADESCVTLADVPRVAERADVAVIKLMKCGGLREAIRMIHTARAHGLEVMLGCMVESNASIAAAAHLAPLLDYADLDGSLLLADDPYAGVRIAGGEIDLGGLARAGTGVRER